ncbi:hypothetical protein C8F01DRAFT_1100227 [Mycena amicta]|nr:hypothetical protein C8F01DRAFT_1100227 [Mycena amicta]
MQVSLYLGICRGFLSPLLLAQVFKRSPEFTLNLSDPLKVALRARGESSAGTCRTLEHLVAIRELWLQSCSERQTI